MRCFNIENRKEIEEYLYTSCTHDGVFTNAVYDQISKTFTVHIDNPVWNGTEDLVFAGVCMFVSVADYKWGDNEQVNALVMLDSTKEPPGYVKNCEFEDKLCFVWEMFSGNQIFIVCSELRV